MAKYVKMFNLHGQKQLTAPTHTALFFLFGWYLSTPLPSQHGQKQQPAPTHIATLLSLWLVPFCTPPQPTWPETTTCTNPHCHSPFSLVDTFLPFCNPHQPTCQKQQPAPTLTATLLSLWLVPFCTPPQPTWPETTTCTNPHWHSHFSLVGIFLQPSPANMARNNCLHQPKLPLSFLCGWCTFLRACGLVAGVPHAS